jgi:hypothetical protein
MLAYLPYMHPMGYVPFPCFVGMGLSENACDTELLEQTSQNSNIALDVF